MKKNVLIWVGLILFPLLICNAGYTTSNNLRIVFKIIKLGDWDSDISNPVVRGYQYLERRKFDLALSQFNKAQRVFLPESVNYLPWIGKAEALCRSGKKVDGRSYLHNFKCATDLQSNRKYCDDMERGGKLINKAEALCYAEFCKSEIIRPAYQRNSDETAALKLYTNYSEQLIKNVSKTCIG